MSEPAAPRRRFTVVGLGEVLWDRFPTGGRRPGGAPANVAFHAARAGHRGVVASAVGDDDDGRELVALLEGRGVETGLLQRPSGAPTGLVDVHEEGDGPSYTIHDDVAWDRLVFDDRWAELFGGADAVCFGSLAQRHEASRECVAACLRATPAECLKIFDVNVRPPWCPEGVVADSFAACDLLKLSSEEIAEVGRIVGVADEEPKSFAGELASRSGKSVAVTLGGDGAILATAGGVISAPAGEADVIDTVGAGDAFTAGLTLGLLDDLPAEEALRLANGLGGLVASSEGAMPDYDDRLARLLDEFGLARSA